jgi:hypothetical protein
VLDLPAQRFAGGQDMVLPREFVERDWPHAIGERTFLVHLFRIAERGCIEQAQA